MTRNIFDTIIIGGSIAGLSAALTLARSLKNVAVFDTQNPCNVNVVKSFNFSTNDGRNPSEIVKNTKEEIAQYNSVEFFCDEVITVNSSDGIFNVETKSIGTFSAKSILIATGLRDILPEISGMQECWGKTVFSCPYCHGYEARNQKTAVYANGDAAHDLSILLTNWSKDLIILTDGESELADFQTAELEIRNIQIIQTKIDSLTQNNGELSQVNFIDGTTLSVPYMYASVPFDQKSNLAEQLGLAFTESGHIEVDPTFRTSLRNVYAAGDCTAQQRALSVASASGTTAGFTINQDFVDDLHNEFIKL